MDHPHLHCIVPGGGLNGDEWIAGAGEEFLFPVKVVAALFRGKFMAYFKSAISSGELQFHGDLKCFEEDKAFLQQLIDCCYSTD